MTIPRVSIVMSVYNGERHLRSAMESILQQTFYDFEFVVVNDGSTDGTREILAEFESRDARLRVVDQQNTGLTIALRNGCAAALGEFIARQDADDWSDPTRLEKLVTLLDCHPEAVMASSWARYVDDDGELVETISRDADSNEATRKLIYEKCGPPAHGSVIFRRAAYESVGGYRPCFYYGQDSDLWLRLAALGQIAYVADLLYCWRQSIHGISAASSDWQSQFGDLGQQCHAARLRGEPEEPFLRRAEELRHELLLAKRKRPDTRRQQAAAHYRIGTSLSRRGASSARRHFWSAIRLDPFHWRSWCRLCAGFLPRRARAASGPVKTSGRP